MPTLAVSSTLGLVALGTLALNAVLGFMVWSKTNLRLPGRITRDPRDEARARGLGAPAARGYDERRVDPARTRQ